MMRLIIAYTTVPFDLHIAFGLVEICRYYCVGFSRLNHTVKHPPDTRCCSNHVHDASSWYSQTLNRGCFWGGESLSSPYVTRGSYCFHLLSHFVGFLHPSHIRIRYKMWSAAFYHRSQRFTVMQIDIKSDLCLMWCCPGHPHLGRCWRTLCNSWMWVKLGEVHRGNSS